MYSATGKDVLFLIFLIFAEKNLSFHISSFNESTGFGLLKASPVEFVKYPFSCLQNKILFSKLKYCGLGNTVNGSCLFLSYGTTVPQKSCACTNQQHTLKLPPQLSRTDWDCFQFGLFYFYICRGPYKQHKLESDNKVML